MIGKSYKDREDSNGSKRARFVLDQAKMSSTTPGRRSLHTSERNQRRDGSRLDDVGSGFARHRVRLPLAATVRWMRLSGPAMSSGVVFHTIACDYP